MSIVPLVSARLAPRRLQSQHPDTTQRLLNTPTCNSDKFKFHCHFVWLGRSVKEGACLCFLCRLHGYTNYTELFFQSRACLPRSSPLMCTRLRVHQPSTWWCLHAKGRNERQKCMRHNTNRTTPYVRSCESYRYWRLCTAAHGKERYGCQHQRRHSCEERGANHSHAALCYLCSTGDAAQTSFVAHIL
jgi:hypothetical protein